MKTNTMTERCQRFERIHAKLALLGYVRPDDRDSHVEETLLGLIQRLENQRDQTQTHTKNT